MTTCPEQLSKHDNEGLPSGPRVRKLALTMRYRVLHDKHLGTDNRAPEAKKDVCYYLRVN